MFAISILNERHDVIDCYINREPHFHAVTVQRRVELSHRMLASLRLAKTTDGIGHFLQDGVQFDLLLLCVGFNEVLDVRVYSSQNSRHQRLRAAGARRLRS